MDFWELSGRQIQYPDWVLSGKFEFHLVTTETIAECIDLCISAPSGRFALDVETTGLDSRVFNGETKDKLVGVCLSPDGRRGYYLPLRHEVGAEHNIPYPLFDREFRRLTDAVMAEKVVAVLHNPKFDLEFLEFNGGEPFGVFDRPKFFEDSETLIFLRNSRTLNKSLKAFAGAPVDAPSDSMTGGPGLGMKMLTLEDIFPEDHPKNQYDFSKLDPSERGPTVYGCSDAICTWLAVDMLLPVVLDPPHGFNQRTIYRIEKACIAASRWMERNRIPLNLDVVRELILLGQREWFSSVMAVYESASSILGRDVMPGFYKVLRERWEPNDMLNLLPQQLAFAKAQESIRYPNPVGKIQKGDTYFPLVYDINSAKQLGMVFQEMEVPGLTFTEKPGRDGSKQVDTSKEALARLLDEQGDNLPFLSKIRRFRETNRALVNFLFRMLQDSEPTDGTMRISFRHNKTDTGRFSTPSQDSDMSAADLQKASKVQGSPEINFQGIPSTYDSKRPESMNRLRECVEAPEGSYIVAIDFSGEELRLITNMSREPKWWDEFFHCSGCDRKFPRGDGDKTPLAPPPRCPDCGSDKIGDLHTLTGLEIFGKDAQSQPDWKKLRGKAKSTNFALSYGGGGSAVMRATGCDKTEGWRIKTKFDGSYPGLKRWWANQHAFAKKYGFVLTPFGRVYPVPDIWHTDGFFRSKAERNATNGPIQGGGADIIKIAMSLVYQGVKAKGWQDRCKLIATMHDELVFVIHGSILEEAINWLVPTMTRNEFLLGMNWPVPFTSDVEIGRNWLVPWDLNAMRYGEAHFIGDKKAKEPSKPLLKDYPDLASFEAALAKFKDDHAQWENLPSWPASLIPLFKDFGPKGRVPASCMPTPAESEPEGTTLPVPEIPPEISGSAPLPPSPLRAGSDFVFQLRSSLTTVTGVLLAQVIEECRGRGTKRLKILSRDGIPIEGWTKHDVFVNDQHFYFTARSRGLV